MLGVFGKPTGDGVGMSRRETQSKLHWGHLGRPVGAVACGRRPGASLAGKPAQDCLGRLVGAPMGKGLGHGKFWGQAALRPGTIPEACRN